MGNKIWYDNMKIRVGIIVKKWTREGEVAGRPEEPERFLGKPPPLHTSYRGPDGALFALHAEVGAESWPMEVFLEFKMHHIEHCRSPRVRSPSLQMNTVFIFPLLDRLSGTLYLSHYVTETSHLNSLRDFWRHFGLCRAVAHSDWCFFAPCINILTYLLIYLLILFARSLLSFLWKRWSYYLQSLNVD